MPYQMRQMRQQSSTGRYLTGPCLAVALAGGLVAAIAWPAAAEVRLGGDRVTVGGRSVNELVIDRLEQGAGRGGRIRLEANTVDRTAVDGNLALRTEIGRLVQHAEGRDAVAATAVGMVSDTSVGGDLTNTVAVGSSVNIAIGAGALACTELGIIGPSGICR